MPQNATPKFDAPHVEAPSPASERKPSAHPSARQIKPDEIPLIGGEKIITDLRIGNIGPLRKTDPSLFTEAFVRSEQFLDASQLAAIRCLEDARIDDFLWMKRNSLFDESIFQTPEVEEGLKRIAYLDPRTMTEDPRYTGLVPQSIINSPGFQTVLKRSRGKGSRFSNVLYQRNGEPKKKGRS